MKTKMFMRFILVTGLFGLYPAGIYSQVASTGEVIVKPEIRIAREAAGVYGAVYSSQEKSSKLTLHKSFSGETKETDGTFNVENGVKRIRINVEGVVESGKIMVSLTLPSGKLYKDLSIDESANMEWSTSFSIEEGNSEYSGTWKYQVKAAGAKGYYAMSITTY